jgi:hypothetical protein
MQFQNDGQSQNVEDRRGMSPKVAAGGGVAILALIVGLIFGPEAQKFLQQVQQNAPARAGDGGPNPKADPNDKFAVFSRQLMKSIEDVWDDVFAKAGQKYRKPTLVIFDRMVQTDGCGNAPSSVGPFYCPADHKLYMDPEFFRQLEKELGGSSSDFSKAFVTAHEVGHHLQNLLGYSELVDKARKTPKENEMSVRLELQADYLAGVWAHHAVKKGLIKITQDDVREAMKTAKSIGDNVLQERSKGWADPRTFTHGTDAQRMKYLMEGLESGDFSQRKLDTFFKVDYRQL